MGTEGRAGVNNTVNYSMNRWELFTAITCKYFWAAQCSTLLKMPAQAATQKTWYESKYPQNKPRTYNIWACLLLNFEKNSRKLLTHHLSTNEITWPQVFLYLTDWRCAYSVVVWPGLMVFQETHLIMTQWFVGPNFQKCDEDLGPNWSRPWPQ